MASGYRRLVRMSTQRITAEHRAATLFPILHHSLTATEARELKRRSAPGRFPAGRSTHRQLLRRD